jgi:hypothetical protein
LSSGTPRPPSLNQEPAPESKDRGIEKTMMSAVLGLAMMMPAAVFGVGGYVLVNRRP